MEIEDLINKDPSHIAILIVDQDTFGKDFNWLGLAEVCELKAKVEFQRKANDLAGSWSLVAIKAYDFIILCRNDNRITFRCQTQIARLRVDAINNIGFFENDQLLDLSLVTDWFFLKVDASYDDVLSRAERWRSLPKKEILELRDIKNMLNILALIDKKIYFSSDIEKWLDILPRLP